MERMREEGIYGELARVQMIGEVLAAWAKWADEEAVNPRFGAASLEAMVDTIQEVYANVVEELDVGGYTPPSKRAPEGTLQAELDEVFDGDEGRA